MPQVSVYEELCHQQWDMTEPSTPNHAPSCGFALSEKGNVWKRRRQIYRKIDNALNHLRLESSDIESWKKIHSSGNINRDQDQRTGIEWFFFFFCFLLRHPLRMSFRECRGDATTNNENLWKLNFARKQTEALECYEIPRGHVSIYAKRFVWIQLGFGVREFLLLHITREI